MNCHGLEPLNSYHHQYGVLPSFRKSSPSLAPHWAIVLLFGHSAESLNAQKKRLATLPLLAPPAARDSSEVARALNQRCNHHT